ncbi:hypothetical protein J2S70_000625 [Trueperella bonasi]|uniref:Uncharacterized protein n=1 Tax=Trueperella bonasi TaxID=312286 RepID=A0ABT9NGW0_9ACTO|nr:hypothetical protein [Trueperella bonasi]
MVTKHNGIPRMRDTITWTQDLTWLEHTNVWNS